MSVNMLKVSLGFSEFVSQLVHETFDAVMSSQFYQIEKYDELSNALNTPPNIFKEKYITEADFQDFQEKLLGFTPVVGMSVDEKVTVFLSLLLNQEEDLKTVNENKLDEVMFKKLQEFSINKIVEFKKNTLRQFFNQQHNVQLKIESGEIKTKLELFCLNEEAEDKKMQNQSTEIKAKEFQKELFSLENKELNISDKRIRLTEVIDKETKQKTILIDKKSIQQSAQQMALIPTTRLVANPIGANSTSNLLSEISIKFSLR